MNTDVFTFIDIDDTSNLRINCNKLERIQETKNEMPFGEQFFVKTKLMYFESLECRKHFTKEEIDISRKYYTKRFRDTIIPKSHSISSPLNLEDSMPSLTLPQSTVSLITLSLKGTL